MKSNKFDSYSTVRTEFLCPFGLRRLYSLLHFDYLVEHPDEKERSLSFFPSQSSYAFHLRTVLLVTPNISAMSLTSCFRRSLPTNEKLRLCVALVVLALHLTHPQTSYLSLLLVFRSLFLLRLKNHFKSIKLASLSSYLHQHIMYYPLLREVKL